MRVYNQKDIYRRGLFLCFVFLVFSLQSASDRYFPAGEPVEDFKYLPSGAFLKGMALSFDEIFADYLWIQALGYFGGHSHTDKKFPWLRQLIDTTTTLDPYFEDPYEFGGIIFSSILKDIDQSTAIFEKGMKNVPKHHKRYWYLPFFTSFNYMYHKKDYPQAAKYLEVAASFPQRPDYLPLLVGRIYANTENPMNALPFLKQMRDRATTPQMRADLTLRMKEVTIKGHLRFLNNARNIFEREYSRSPYSVVEMFRLGALRDVPIEPLGGVYIVSLDGKEVKTTSKVDNMEIHGKSGEKKFQLEVMPAE